jgi:hypothetical protein
LIRPAIVVLITALALVSCRSGGPEPPAVGPLRFHREHVTVEASGGRTRVVGIYYFRNESDEPLTTMIKYPFPVDRNHMMPFRIRVWEQAEEGLEPLGYVRADASVNWQMRFEPRGERVVRVEYVQEIKKNHAVYIVTTTRAWQRPIELAEFEFRMPAHFADVELSFKPDSVSVSEDTVVYYMRATDFLPDADLSVTWR